MYCDDELQDDEKITYVNNAFAQPHRARKYHDKCYSEMSI